MKLKHLTLVFLVILAGLYSTVFLKSEVRRITEKTEEDIKQAGREGTLAAAGLLAKEKSGEESFLPEERTAAFEEALFTAAAASLGIEYVKDCRERLERLFPMLFICGEDGFTVISTVLSDEGTIKRRTTEYKSFNGDLLSLKNSNGAYILALEETLEKEIFEASKLRAVNRTVTVDLPEYSMDISVRSISEPAVLAVSFAENALTGRCNINVTGATIRQAPKWVATVSGQGKRYHTDSCAILRENLDTGRERYDGEFETKREAVAAGYYPSECCNPLDHYFFDTSGISVGSD